MVSVLLVVWFVARAEQRDGAARAELRNALLLYFNDIRIPLQNRRRNCSSKVDKRFPTPKVTAKYIHEGAGVMIQRWLMGNIQWGFLQLLFYISLCDKCALQFEPKWMR